MRGLLRILARALRRTGLLPSKTEQRPVAASNPRAHQVRLGHALGDKSNPADSDAVLSALRIARGDEELTAREPTARQAVLRAERVLRIPSNERPIYAFLGDLHPKLGSVGIIVERRWCSCIQGVSRCDTGGLAGQAGAFARLAGGKVDEALRRLSFIEENEVANWPEEFCRELGASYEDVKQYVAGDRPNSQDWQNDDIRRTLLEDDEDDDRRLWTWEVRLRSGPESADIHALALSVEAFKEMLALRHDVGAPPDHVRVLRPTSGEAAGVLSWFHTKQVRKALEGDAA